MTIDNIIEQGGTLVVDPYESSFTPDEFLTRYGNIVNSLCIVAKSERGSTYYPSGTAPKDPKFGELFTSFSQITTDIGIRTYALIHGNKDGFFSRDPNFQMHRSGGNPIPNYVCLNQKVYWNYVSEIAAEIANKTSVEGIIMKDVHFPRENACFCDNCRMTFSSDNDFNRDFTYDQISKSSKYEKWSRRRNNATTGMISNVIQRVHQERKLDVISELLLDPQTDYFEGAEKHFGQELTVISQATSHILLHLHPWSDLPTTQEQIDLLFNSISSQISILNSVDNSIFIWGPTEAQFEVAVRIRDALGSKNIFFTADKPTNYLEARSLHLDLGV